MLAHSLRDAGTTKKLAVLVTLDSVSAEVVTQLKACLHLKSRAHVAGAYPNPNHPLAGHL